MVDRVSEASVPPNLGCCCGLCMPDGVPVCWTTVSEPVREVVAKPSAPGAEPLAEPEVEPSELCPNLHDEFDEGSSAGSPGPLEVPEVEPSGLVEVS